MNEKITYSPELQRLFDIWHRAKDFNDANAQFKLGEYFLKSRQRGAQQKAFSLFKKLANQGYTQVQTDAQYMLGRCYENGYGITKSYQRAICRYEKAAYNVSSDLVNNPDPVGEEANKALEEMIEENDGNIDKALDMILYGMITPELIDSTAEAAESGDIDAQKYLMNLYSTGGGDIEENYEESAYWAEKAARNGNTEAMNKLGHMFYYGQGVEQDFEAALYWLEKAAEQGAEASAHLLGKYYKTLKQYKIAVKWYREYAGLKIKWRNNRLGWETGNVNQEE